MSAIYAHNTNQFNNKANLMIARFEWIDWLILPLSHDFWKASCFRAHDSCILVHDWWLTVDGAWFMDDGWWHIAKREGKYKPTRLGGGGGASISRIGFLVVILIWCFSKISNPLDELELPNKFISCFLRSITHSRFSGILEAYLDVFAVCVFQTCCYCQVVDFSKTN